MPTAVLDRISHLKKVIATQQGEQLDALLDLGGLQSTEQTEKCKAGWVECWNNDWTQFNQWVNQ